MDVLGWGESAPPCGNGCGCCCLGGEGLEARRWARRISVSRAWFEMFDRYPSKGGNGSAKEELSRLLLRGKLNVQ